MFCNCGLHGKFYTLNQSIENYSEIAEKFHFELMKLGLNVITDKFGGFGSAETPYKKDFSLLRESMNYRLSALGWHVHNICQQHSHFELLFQSNMQDMNNIMLHAKSRQSFAFDDLIFNLISLYDYYANLLAFILIGENKKQIGWSRFAKSAMGSQNEFSKLSIAKEIAAHENGWVKRIRDFRAEVIHYNLVNGNDKMQISVKQGETPKYELMYSIPEKLSKKLDLKAPVHEGVGIDLQFGALEIAERSLEWLANLTLKVTLEFTKNSVEFIKK